MNFTCKKPCENIINLARKLGYRLLKGTGHEFNLIRLLGRGYPRFHLYLKEQGKDLIFNLHLDQKKPVYRGQTWHAGEYDGKLVKGEKQRIENILEKMM